MYDLFLDVCNSAVQRGVGAGGICSEKRRGRGGRGVRRKGVWAVEVFGGREGFRVLGFREISSEISEFRVKGLETFFWVKGFWVLERNLLKIWGSEFREIF